MAEQLSSDLDIISVTMTRKQWADLNVAVREGVTNDYDGLDDRIEAEKNDTDKAIMTAVRSMQEQIA